MSIFGALKSLATESADRRFESLSEAERARVEQGREEGLDLDESLEALRREGEQAQIDSLRAQLSGEEASENRPVRDISSAKQGAKKPAGFFGKLANGFKNKVVKGVANMAAAPVLVLKDWAMAAGRGVKNMAQNFQDRGLYSGDPKKNRATLLRQGGMVDQLSKTDPARALDLRKRLMKDTNGEFAKVLAARTLEARDYVVNKKIEKGEHAAMQAVEGRHGVIDPFTNPLGKATPTAATAIGKKVGNRLKQFSIVKLLSDPFNELAGLTRTFAGGFLAQGFAKTDLNAVYESEEFAEAVTATVGEYDVYRELDDAEKAESGMVPQGEGFRVGKFVSDVLVRNTAVGLVPRYLEKRWPTLAAGVFHMTGAAIFGRTLAKAGMQEARSRNVHAELEKRGVVAQLQGCPALGMNNAEQVAATLQSRDGLRVLVEKLGVHLEAAPEEQLESAFAALQNIQEMAAAGVLDTQVSSYNALEIRMVMQRIRNIRARAEQALSRFDAMDSMVEANGTYGAVSTGASRSFSARVGGSFRSLGAVMTGKKRGWSEQLRRQVGAQNGIGTVMSIAAGVATVVVSGKIFKVAVDAFDQWSFNQSLGAETAANVQFHGFVADNLGDTAGNLYAHSVHAAEQMQNVVRFPVNAVGSVMQSAGVVPSNNIPDFERGRDGNFDKAVQETWTTRSLERALGALGSVLSTRPAGAAEQSSLPGVRVVTQESEGGAPAAPKATATPTEGLEDTFTRIPKSVPALRVTATPAEGMPDTFTRNGLAKASATPVDALTDSFSKTSAGTKPARMVIVTEALEDTFTRIPKAPAAPKVAGTPVEGMPDTFTREGKVAGVKAEGQVIVAEGLEDTFTRTGEYPSAPEKGRLARAWDGFTSLFGKDTEKASEPAKEPTAEAKQGWFARGLESLNRWIGRESKVVTLSTPDASDKVTRVAEELERITAEADAVDSAEAPATLKQVKLRSTIEAGSSLWKDMRVDGGIDDATIAKILNASGYKPGDHLDRVYVGQEYEVYVDSDGVTKVGLVNDLGTPAITPRPDVTPEAGPVVAGTSMIDAAVPGCDTDQSDASMTHAGSGADGAAVGADSGKAVFSLLPSVPDRTTVVHAKPYPEADRAVMPEMELQAHREFAKDKERQKAFKAMLMKEGMTEHDAKEYLDNWKDNKFEGKKGVGSHGLLISMLGNDHRNDSGNGDKITNGMRHEHRFPILSFIRWSGGKVYKDEYLKAAEKGKSPNVRPNSVEWDGVIDESSVCRQLDELNDQGLLLPALRYFEAQGVGAIQSMGYEPVHTGRVITNAQSEINALDPVRLHHFQQGIRLSLMAGHGTIMDDPAISRYLLGQDSPHAEPVAATIDSALFQQALSETGALHLTDADVAKVKAAMADLSKRNTDSRLSLGAVYGDGTMNVGAGYRLIDLEKGGRIFVGAGVNSAGQAAAGAMYSVDANKHIGFDIGVVPEGGTFQPAAGVHVTMLNDHDFEVKGRAGISPFGIGAAVSLERNVPKAYREHVDQAFTKEFGMLKTPVMNMTPGELETAVLSGKITVEAIRQQVPLIDRYLANLNPNNQAIPQEILDATTRELFLSYVNQSYNHATESFRSPVFRGAGFGFGAFEGGYAYGPFALFAITRTNVKATLDANPLQVQADTMVEAMQGRADYRYSITGSSSGDMRFSEASGVLRQGEQGVHKLGSVRIDMVNGETGELITTGGDTMQRLGLSLSHYDPATRTLYVCSDDPDDTGALMNFVTDGSGVTAQRAGNGYEIVLPPGKSQLHVHRAVVDSGAPERHIEGKKDKREINRVETYMISATAGAESAPSTGALKLDPVRAQEIQNAFVIDTFDGTQDAQLMALAGKPELIRVYQDIVKDAPNQQQTIVLFDAYLRSKLGAEEYNKLALKEGDRLNDLQSAMIHGSLSDVTKNPDGTPRNDAEIKKAVAANLIAPSTVKSVAALAHMPEGQIREYLQRTLTATSQSFDAAGGSWKGVAAGAKHAPDGAMFTTATKVGMMSGVNSDDRVRMAGTTELSPQTDKEAFGKFFDATYSDAALAAKLAPIAAVGMDKASFGKMLTEREKNPVLKSLIDQVRPAIHSGQKNITVTLSDGTKATLTMNASVMLGIEAGAKECGNWSVVSSFDVSAEGVGVQKQSGSVEILGSQGFGAVPTRVEVTKESTVLGTGIFFKHDSVGRNRKPNERGDGPDENAPGHDTPFVPSPDPAPAPAPDPQYPTPPQGPNDPYEPPF